MDEKMVFMNQADFVLRFCGAVEQNEFIEPYFVTTLNLMTKNAIKFGRGPQICFVEAHKMKSNSHQSKDDLWTKLSTNNSYLIQAQPSQAKPIGPNFCLLTASSYVQSDCHKQLKKG